MKMRLVGIVLFLGFIFLVGLQLNFPIVRSNVALEEHNIPIVFLDLFRETTGEPVFAEKNVTLTPSKNTSNVTYSVTALVAATVWNSTNPKNYTLIDFWVVNHTGRNLLYHYLENSSQTYYFYTNLTQPFLPGIKTYAGSADKAIMVLRLRDLDYDGNYTLILINPYSEATANVTIVIEEVFTIERHFINPNNASISVTMVAAILGLYMTVKNPRWFSKKVRKGRIRQ